MKLDFFLFIGLLVLIQAYSSQARLTPSLSESTRAKRSLEKRLHTQWGKRAESNSDELYQRILRELYHSARLTQAANPHYSANHDANGLTLEQLLAQRHTWNEENAGAPDNLS